MNLIYFAVFAACACFVNGQTRSCETASGGSGECISIFNCPVLLESLKRLNAGRQISQDITLLKRSRCGFQGNAPAVCCPIQTQQTQLPQGVCYTPEGNIGRCINLYSCPHLVNLLTPPVLSTNKDYIRRSICQGTEQHSVCCGPPPPPRRDQDLTDTLGCAAKVSAYPPDPRTECCGVDGRVGNKIVGGTETTVDQYPWLAIIKYTNFALQCGGALISGRYVLTAAHCVSGRILTKGTPTTVILGEYDTSNEGPDCIAVDGGGIDCTEGVIKIPIEKTIPHLQYNSRDKHNDIGLIRLAEYAPFTEFIRPICLPTIDLTEPQNVPNNFTMFAAGWGAISTFIRKNNIKLHVDLPYVNLQDCQVKYTEPRLRAALWRAQMCAGGIAGKDSCRGDSGGPLMYEDGKTFQVIGIVSFGPEICGENGVPGVYSKVYEYLDWIRSNIVP